MAVTLNELVVPSSTAVLVFEMQRGVVGDLSSHPIAGVVQASGIIPRIATLLEDARSAGAQVVFCNVVRRVDGKGSARNAPALALRPGDVGIAEGSPSAENLHEFSLQSADFISHRYHGVSPFAGTSLDAALRNMGIRNIIAAGVSLNLGIMGMCIEGVGLGYRVVVPRDAVVGLPIEYGDAVLKYSIPAVAKVTSVDEITSVWRDGITSATRS